MEKRIALLLFGLSYLPVYKNPTYHKNYVIDFRNSVENYNKFIFDYYKENGYIIDVFFVTNNYDNVNIKNELLKTYNPIAHEFSDDIPKDTFRQKRNKKVQKVFNLYMNHVKTTNVNYEYVLLTRFDLHFKIPFNKLSFDYDTINIAARLNPSDCGDRIDDNFYLIPTNLITQFKKSIDASNDKSSHLLIADFLTFCKPNYLLPDVYLVRNIPIFEIVRTRK